MVFTSVSGQSAPSQVTLAMVGFWFLSFARTYTRSTASSQPASGVPARTRRLQRMGTPGVPVADTAPGQATCTAPKNTVFFAASGTPFSVLGGIVTVKLAPSESGAPLGSVRTQPSALGDSGRAHAAHEIEIGSPFGFTASASKVTVSPGAAYGLSTRVARIAGPVRREAGLKSLPHPVTSNVAARNRRFTASPAARGSASAAGRP